MKRTTRNFVISLSLAIVFLSASSLSAQIDVGDYTISGSAEVDGLPRSFSGNKSEFETYRDVPETVVVPQLQLMIGGKKQDYYLNFDAGNVGLDNQIYTLRFGRYGLLDVELEWNQIPHVFNVDNARTPYDMNNGRYTLFSRPTATDATTFSNWINDPSNTRHVDLKLLDEIGKISIRYTPTPGWTFTGKYWSEIKDGKRAISFPFGTGSSSSIEELAEPIDYQTHNIELGGEYAGKGWTVGLKYNGSLFHNSTSTLIFDNPGATGPGCTDAVGDPCRGRVDLYPSNQAHTFTLTGTASLPLKTHFLGTASYGWRLQSDPFLPFTINSAIAEPTLSRGSLDGDVRPAMVNLTLVNNFVDRLSLKAYYRFYDLNNRTSSVSTSGGTVRNDVASTNDWTTAYFYAYSKNSGGASASYQFARWLTGKFNFDWDRTHRSINVVDETNEFLNADEFRIGPTVDIKPNSWLLLRAAYQRSWRTAPGYNPSNDRQMVWLAERNQNKASLFAQVSPWETLTFYSGFDYVVDKYPDTVYGVQYGRSYSPSVGVLYSPLEWVKLFADYNFDWYSWRQDSPSGGGFISRGKNKVNTFSLGSDMDLIKDVLSFHIQYAFSQGIAEITNGAVQPQWPNNTNTWQQLLAKFEYQVHKNITLQAGYYFNRFHSKDFGVDIMKLWMGDFDPTQVNGVFLGNEFKGSYTANIALLGLKFKF